MKKFVLSFFTLLISVSHAFADGESAMLQQGDSIQIFYGTTALTQAYSAADSAGAVITLSPGNFGSLTIEKKNLKVIGNYGLTHTLEISFLSSLTIAADNVNIDGLVNKSRGEYAYTMLDFDQHPSQAVVEHLKQVEGVVRVRVIK